MMNSEGTKEEEKKNIMEGLSLTKVSEMIDTLIEKEDMKELKILKDHLIKYKSEVESKIKDKKKIEHESFKQHLFRNLEKNLLYGIYIKNNEMRKEKIRKTYLWFLERLKKWNSLDKIKYRTDKNVDEKYKPEEIASDDIIVKDDEYELKEFKLHRTDIPGLEPPKERLSQYKTKEIRPPLRFRKDKNTMEHLRFNINRFHGRVGSANNMVQLKPDKYYTKTGNNYYNPTNIPLTSENQPIEIRKEVKSAYSYNRPPYKLTQLNIEKKIIEAKNVELREKRSQEEIKKFMDEAAIAKAKYREKREIKFSIDNIIKEYEKTFKVDKTADQLIQEQKEKELNKDNRINEFINANLTYKNSLPITYNTNMISNLNANETFKISNNTNKSMNNNNQTNSFVNLDNVNNLNKSSKNNINNNTGILEFEKISGKYPNCYTNINNKVIYSKIENKNDFVKVEEEVPVKQEENEDNDENQLEEKKVIIIKKDILPKKEEKKYNLTLKANKTELFDKIKKDQNETNKIKFDTVAYGLVNDRILKARIQSAKMCGVKEIAPKKVEYMQYYVPLSAYDETNYKTYTDKFYYTKAKYNRPKTASEFALRNFSNYENNYLKLRKEMTKFYDQEKETMDKMLNTQIDKISKEPEKEKETDKDRSKLGTNRQLTNVSRSKTTIRIVPIENNIKKVGTLVNNHFEQLFERPLEGPPRPMYYLPKPELGLLNKPPGMKAKKKKKGKKKKRR